MREHARPEHRVQHCSNRNHPGTTPGLSPDCPDLLFYGKVLPFARPFEVEDLASSVTLKGSELVLGTAIMGDLR